MVSLAGMVYACCKHNKVLHSTAFIMCQVVLSWQRESRIVLLPIGDFEKLFAQTMAIWD